MKILSFFLITLIGVFTFPVNACLKPQTCQHSHEYDPEVLEEIANDTSQANDDYLYDFSLPDLKADPSIILRAKEKHIQKATKYFELKNFEKCLEEIRRAEKYITIFDDEDSVEISKIIAYKAYCKMYLGKYESAAEYFEDLINHLISTEHYKPCLFATYFYHAFCVYASGNEKRAKSKISKLVDMKLVDKDRAMHIYDQPCFHPNGISESHLLKVSRDIAEATGYNILSANNQFYPDIALCNNSNETAEACSENCTYLAGIGAYAAAYIPNRHVQAAVLFSLVLFQVQCTKCCTDGLGSDNCLKSLKTILKYTLNQNLLDDL